MKRTKYEAFAKLHRFHILYIRRSCKPLIRPAKEILELITHALTWPPIKLLHRINQLDLTWFPNFESKIRNRAMLFNESLIEHLNTFVGPNYNNPSVLFAHVNGCNASAFVPFTAVCFFLV